MKSCSPRLCLNCILQKKGTTNPSSSQSQLTKCYFLRLCLHDLSGLFVVFCCSCESWAIGVHCFYLRSLKCCTLSVYVPWPIRGVFVGVHAIMLPQFLWISSSITLAYFHHVSSLLAAMYFQFTPICESQRAGVEAAGLDWGVIWGWNGWTFSPAECLPNTHTHTWKRTRAQTKITPIDSDRVALLLAIEYYSLTQG